jgi:rhodanese-related sulfurtransferase
VVDLSRVYVPETYLLPQLAGGLVFGVGFVMGGLCPGTSCVAASTGRLDGLMVMGGMIGGILVFAELFPLVEPFYGSTARGSLTFPQLLGVPHGAIVLLVVVMAVAGFAGARWYESRKTVESRKLKVESGGTGIFRSANVRLAMIALLLGMGAAFVGDPASLRAGFVDANSVSAVELARWIHDRRPALHIIDLRSPAAYMDFGVPLADNIAGADLTSTVLDSASTIVLYAEDDAAAARAAVGLRARGQRDVRVLRGGAEAWLFDVLTPVLRADASAEDRAAFDEVAKLSRYFGGTPQLVARTTEDSEAYIRKLRVLKRRGCGAR